MSHLLLPLVMAAALSSVSGGLKHPRLHVEEETHHRLPPSVSYLLGVGVDTVVTEGATRLPGSVSCTTTAPASPLLLLMRSRSLWASSMSVSDSEVNLVSSGEVSGVVFVELGDGTTVYGNPKAGWITPV